MTANPTPLLRDRAAAFVLWLSFLAGCLYYDAGTNVIMLLTSTGMLLVAMVILGPQRLAVGIARRELSVLLCLWAILVITLSQLFVTISPDSSFPSSWVFACIPLWFLAASALPDRRLLHQLVLVTALALAGISVLRFVWSGQVAYEPLSDPNNYAGLLYVVWIPLVHALLVRLWARTTSAWHLALGSAAAVVLATAVLATFSRVGGAVLIAATLGWLALAAARRMPFKPLLLPALALACAYVVLVAFDPGAAAAKLSGESVDAGLAVRLALWEAAARIWVEAPLSGTGLNTFALLYPLWRTPVDQDTGGVFVHNDYLQLLLETGLWLLPVLVVIAVATARHLFRALAVDDAPSLRRFGFAMALAALLAHALLNFVFYTLALAIAFALLCAELYPGAQPGAETPEPHARRTGLRAGPVVRGAWFAGLACGLIAWVLLAIDTVTLGVFGSQPTAAFVRELRQDESAMLRYSRFAQRLNPSRAVPVLGEALLLGADARRDPESNVLKSDVVVTFRRAIALDPYNPFVYRQYYEFLNAVMDAELAATLTADESPEALLLRALRLDVGQVDTLRVLLEHYDKVGRPQRALDVLKQSVYPWLQLIYRTNPTAGGRVLVEMRRRALAANDDAFLEEIDAVSDELGRITASQRPIWFKSWQQRNFG